MSPDAVGVVISQIKYGFQWTRKFIS
jgi:hypothetical protein